MDRKFRLAALEDAPKLLDLVLRAYAPTLELGINFAAATADLSYIEHHIKNNMCYLMEEDDRLLATCSLRMPWGLHPGPYGLPHICMLAAEPEIGQSGIGSAMLKWIEGTIVRDTLKSPAVSLGTADKHPWLVEMYEKKGYEKIGAANLGRGHITVYLRKVLMPDLFAEINNKI